VLRGHGRIIGAPGNDPAYNQDHTP
jgi:hypothetical protein